MMVHRPSSEIQADLSRLINQRAAMLLAAEPIQIIDEWWRQHAWPLIDELVDDGTFVVSVELHDGPPPKGEH